MRLLLSTIVILLALPATAFAGGYDTPILYSARHMGMGGTAQAYVNDPSALFHNPAGLGNIEGRLSLLADVSFGTGFVHGVPNQRVGSIESEPSVLPFFLVGGAYKFSDWFTAGLGVFPVAAAGGTYRYQLSDTAPTTVDSTSLFFLEISPGIALTVPESVGIGKLSLGIGYRMTYISLSRDQGPENGDAFLEFSASGFNAAGFRVGLQWEPTEEFSVGLSYRHKIEQTITADTGRAFGMPGGDLVLDSITLPARFAFGVRGDVGALGLAADVEYALQSQNQALFLSGVLNPDTNPSRVDPPVEQTFQWTDAATIRLGVEYDIPLDETYTFTPRLGYVFDGATTNRAYPSAAGTPPAPTHSGTVGVGLDGGAWEVNLAYALRKGSTTVEEAELGDCSLCGGFGEYDITLHGMYVDFSYDIE